MNDIKETHIYETQNVNLATFLMLEGIKLIECRRSSNKKVIIMRFLDEKRTCIDLERVYLGSPYKKYGDIYKYLLSKVHEALRSDPS